MAWAAKIKVQRWRLSPPTWTNGCSLKIALIADPHICTPWTPMSVIDAAIDLTMNENPDLVLLLGDYEAHLPFSRIPSETEVAARFARLSAPLGVFNIFGNHDWRRGHQVTDRGTPETLWHRAFDAAGIETLENRHVALNHLGQDIILAGVASQMALSRPRKRDFSGFDDLEAALEGAAKDTFTILMAHEPDIFHAAPAQVDLTVSGHTHGGQIRPFGRAFYVPSQFGDRYAYGLVQEAARHLVVSGGIGYSGIPLRWRMPPEITMIELE